MRVFLVQKRGGSQADLFHDPKADLLSLSLAILIVNDQRVTNRLANGHPRVQGSVGILEDDLELLPQLFHIFF